MFVKEYLENGIPVVMEPFKNIRSVAVGVWVKVGSRYEKPAMNGISHFLEHMFFKGTTKRSPKDIAVEIDSMGGDLNAFTSRENTAFYIKVLDEYLEKGVDLLSDIFVHSTFPENELEKEKKIIKEEVKMVEDTPDDYIHDLFNQTIWGQEGLGQSILGRRETIASFTREDLMHHISKYYGTKDIIISCAGKFQPAKLMGLLRDRFGGLRRGSEPKKGPPPEFRSDVKVYTKDIAEAHVCIGVPSVSQTSEDRYALFVLNTLLGGGVSSRLFQEIRENRGLAYSVYSYTSMYIDTGLWGVYAGVSKKRIREVAELIIHEMFSLKDTLTAEELDKAKKHLKGNMILGLESTNSRMNNIARQEISFGRYISPDEISKAVEIVSLKQIKELSERLLAKKSLSITAYGPLQKDVLDGIL
ncbi:MAG: putative Zn-dependent peptidase [Nitrospirae bacterium]|jgi:predicted Zn-dependent peptidase|nr:putative Zn-dependent peptidase [Nitrospirota bacterium]MBS1126636.1 putative Zn-dependent peptidase [Nitrospirota bacterium]MBS1234620.1 putative Zn-dependent peptidase [Nitrospirota bacterium]